MQIVNESAAKKLVEMSKDENCIYRFEWATSKKEFSIISASQFFIGVMLDMRMKFNRAWEAGKHIVESHFNRDEIWYIISNKELSELEEINRVGFGEKKHGKDFSGSYSGININFAKNLKSNAEKIVKVYKGDPRNIWNVSPNDVEIIYKRFIEFNGIGDALAKMAQFLLVGKHGVAGGIKSKCFLKAKPDRHVCKVIKRLGLSETDKPKDVTKSIDDLDSDSQADIDAILFNIGREFCFSTNPQCERCPFDNECAHNFS